MESMFADDTVICSKQVEGSLETAEGMLWRKEE